MSGQAGARLWTSAELDRVHPLPDGWTWGYRPGGAICARRELSGRYRHDVWVDGRCIRSTCSMPMADPYHEDPPADVALAVVLASKGLDSYGAMAAALEVEARNHREWAGPTTPTGQANTADAMSESAAVADAYDHAAKMLRSGVVPT